MSRARSGCANRGRIRFRPPTRPLSPSRPPAAPASKQDRGRPPCRSDPGLVPQAASIQRTRSDVRHVHRGFSPPRTRCGPRSPANAVRRRRRPSCTAGHRVPFPMVQHPQHGHHRVPDTTADVLRNDHQQVDVATPVGVPAGLGSEQDHLQRIELVHQLVRHPLDAGPYLFRFRRIHIGSLVLQVHGRSIADNTPSAGSRIGQSSHGGTVEPGMISALWQARRERQEHTAAGQSPPNGSLTTSPGPVLARIAMSTRASGFRLP